ncbi:hypothetical protein GX586_06770 [bacterium]|nr:hypothetical protein [bacterium]
MNRANHSSHLLAALVACSVCIACVADSVVVFNELMYHPAQDGAASEWIELHNQMAVDIDLSDWRLSGGVDYTFPAGTIIPGKGYLVIAADPAALKSQTGLQNIIGPFDGQLSNSGEALRLRDNSNRVLDELEYNDAGEWPPAADGSGASLAKINRDTATGPAENWRASIQPGGTPGLPNTFPAPPAVLMLNEIAPAGSTSFWLEIINAGNAAAQLAGVQIASSSGAGPCVLPAGILGPGSFRVVQAAELGFTPGASDKLFLYTSNRTAVLDGAGVSARLRGRAPDAAGPWAYPAVETPGASNIVQASDAIAINEIMYHHRPVYAQPPHYQLTPCQTIDGQWRYNQSGANLGTGWRATEFNDASWPAGDGLFYYSSSALPGPKNTALTLGRTTYYFRTSFVFSNDPAATSLSIHPIIDDGAVFYLNGAEIYRYNMPGGTISHSTFASSSIATPMYTNIIYIPATTLVQGTNVLAVEVHQASSSGNDVVFGTEFFAETLVSPGTPFQDNDEEWIELYNRSGAPVSLAGWRIGGGVDYTFPAGSVLSAGQYLVVAGDAAAMTTQHPAIAIVGNFAGRLGNGSDRILLYDAFGNVADDVRYYDGAPWPSYADGAGSSLELRDPRADNSKPEAWAASDESARSSWNTYTYRNVADGAIRPTNFIEFVAEMLDEGEILMDDISVVEDPRGAAKELIKNPSFGSGATSWRCTGNHEGSTVVTDPADAGNKALRIVATGPGEYILNHIETTLADTTMIKPGTEYAISFRAKWLAGSPLVHTRLYFNRVPRTTVIEQPSLSGTPGAQNSRYAGNIGPAFSGLRHAPVVPNASQPVTVTIAAGDPDGIASCRLFWSVNEGAWSSAAMAAGGVYTAAIPGAAAASIVQFYVQAVDGLNATSFYPAAGVDSRALYVVQDGQASTLPVHNFRIIMRTSDANRLFQDINRFSDAYQGATVVYDENEAYYDVGMRLKGYSTRKGNDTGFKLSFKADRLFRGVHANVAADRSGRMMGQTYSNNSQEEIFTKQIANRAGGIIGQYDDIVRCIGPSAGYTRSALLLMGRYGDEYFDALWADGAAGPAYRLELVYYVTATTDGNPESPKQMPSTALQGTIQIDVGNLGDDGEWYRWHTLGMNNRGRNDFSPVVTLAKTFTATGAALDAAIPNVIDEDQWMRMFAYLSLVCVFDTYNFGGIHHNVYYQRPEDKRMLVYPVDMDWAFEPNVWIRGTNAPLWGAISSSTHFNLNKIITSPRNLRRLYGHFKDIIDTSYNPAYMQRWADHYYSLLEDQPGFQGNISFIRDRIECVMRRLPPTAPYRITTNNGQPFSTSNLNTRISGIASYDVRSIGVQGRPDPTGWDWATITNWSCTVSLQPGTNVLLFVASSYRGAPVASNSITVICTSTIQFPPVVINELMALNTSTVTDEFGAYADWLELYNAGTTALSMADMHLSDSVLEPAKWRLPAVNLPPHGFLVIWADGETNRGPLHAPFRLSGDGEVASLHLVGPSGTSLIHALTFGPQSADVSFGLYPDGDKGRQEFMQGSPGAPNFIPEPAAVFAVPGLVLMLRRFSGRNARATRCPYSHVC